MIDPAEQAKLDQSIAMMAENVPPMVRGIHQGLLGEGFSPEQSMELTKVYLFALAGGKIATP